MPKAAHKVVVIGHRNPDTDSICSAIAYAELKNKTSDPVSYTHLDVYKRQNKKKLTSPVSFFLCWVHWPAAGTQSSSPVCRACQFFRVQPGRVSGSRPASRCV